MRSITPSATLALKDTSLSPNPNPVPFAGVLVTCPLGAMSQDVDLAAASTAVALPFPIGVTTAKVLAIFPKTVPDLVVTVDGVEHEVPLQQPFFLYNVAAADVSVTSVLGGKLTSVVGG